MDNRRVGSNILKRKRKKTSYQKISNDIRKKLIENEGNLKKIAQELQIKYSTAKTILRIFKIERRIDKKNGISPDRKIRDVFIIEKQEKLRDNGKQSGIPFRDISGTKTLNTLDKKINTSSIVNHTLQVIQKEIDSVSLKINEYNGIIFYLKDQLLKSIEQIKITNNLIQELIKFHHHVQTLHSSIFNETLKDKNSFTSDKHPNKKYYTFNFNFNCSFFGYDPNLKKRFNFPIDFDSNNSEEFLSLKNFPSNMYSKND